MKKRLLLTLIALFIFINVQHAQKFGIAAIAGVNLAQINGDNQRGFKKKLAQRWALEVL